MKSLWTKFLTGIAVAGTLFTMTASASAGGKGFSFGGGGGGGGGSSTRSHSFGGNSGGQSVMKSFSARSLGGNSGNTFKKLNSSGSSLAGGLNQNQFKVRSLGGNGNGNNQFQNLSKSLKSGNRQFNQNLGSQLLGNSNQLKGVQRLGQFNQGQNNKTLDQMLSGARNFQGLKGINKNNGLQGLVGGQFGNNKQFNPAKFNGLNKHANFFGGNFDKHNHNSNKSFFFGNHHHHHNHGWWGWNNWCGPSYYDPWCYRPYYTNYCYPYYGSYPYYNSSVTYVTPVVAPQPAVAAPEQAPQLPLADLVLADLRVMDPGNGADLGPLFQITIANQGPSASPAFEAAIVAAVSKEQLESAVKATAQVGPIEPGQTTKVEIRLPVEAMALQGPSGPAMFELLGVVLDDLNQVDELDEKNNRGLVNRDKIRPIDRAPAPQAAANPSLAANSSAPPRLLSLPPQ